MRLLKATRKKSIKDKNTPQATTHHRVTHTIVNFHKIYYAIGLAIAVVLMALSSVIEKIIPNF